VFCCNLARESFNFVRVVVFSVTPRVLDSHERDRAKARNVGIAGDKDVSAVRRPKCDAQASFCYYCVKVASSWTSYLTDARVRASFVSKEDLPNFVTQSRPATRLIERSIQITLSTRVPFRQQPPELFEEKLGRRLAANLLTKDEARRGESQ